MGRLSTTTRELAAAWIGRAIGVNGAITEEQAGQMLAEANACDWGNLSAGDRDWYIGRARDLLDRISSGPRAIPLRDISVWRVLEMETHQMPF